MSFKQALRNEKFVVTAEMPLTPDSSRESVAADADILRDSVDGVLLTDNQYGQPHMSPIIAAGMLLGGDVSPILQVSCRSRNRIALLGDLLGARALGIDSLMLVRGGVIPEGYSPRPVAVMDVDEKELMATANMINDDEKLGFENEFLIGASATVHDPTETWHPAELIAKADAGAQFVITQPCLDVGVLRRYVAFLVKHHLTRRFSVIVSIAVIQSPELGGWLRDNRNHAVIPAATLDRLANASDPEQEGIEMCAELLQAVAAIPGVSGVNFVPGASLGLIPQVIEKAGNID